MGHLDASPSHTYALHFSPSLDFSAPLFVQEDMGTTEEAANHLRARSFENQAVSPSSVRPYQRRFSADSFV